LVLLIGLACTLLAQIYRYRYVSSPTQQQQIKWVVLGGLIAVVMVIGLGVPNLLVPLSSQTGSFYRLFVSGPADLLAVLLLALSFGLAILRYRLYDIDILINRTLVYGLLTGTLALVYFGLIISLQFLLRGLTNQDSPLAIVASTLVIAALFHPLRKRLQAVIDRRFYRHKYDAAQTLAAFSATLRNEVDLRQLGQQLVEVVQVTMQPSRVLLWLRPSEPSGERKRWMPASSDEQEREEL